MAHLDQIVENLVEVFQGYVDDDGSKKPKIKPAKLQLMLEKEMQRPQLKAIIDNDDIEEAVKLMDKDEDGEVNFHEFCRCVSKLAKSYYHKKLGRGDKKGKKKERKAEPNP